MITDMIINFFIAPVYYLLELVSIPVVDNILIPENAFTALEMIIQNLAYVLPVNTFLFCLAVSFALDNFHIMWALFLRLKSFVPRFY